MKNLLKAEFALFGFHYCKWKTIEMRQIILILWTWIQLDPYSSLAVLIQILAALPVTTATNECSFSAFKYLKTYLQNTTKEVRLNGLAMLYVHRDISLDFKQVNAEFLRKNRRLNFN